MLFFYKTVRQKMTERIKNRMFMEIKRREKGHIFSASDFLKKLKTAKVCKFWVKNNKSLQKHQI
jgi:hypothetical protein